MDDIEYAYAISEEMGRLYKHGKAFSSETPIHALSYLRGLASVFCDALDSSFSSVDRLDVKIKDLEYRGLLKPPIRRSLRILQRNGNIASHPESFEFESHDFKGLVQEALGASRTLFDYLNQLRKNPLSSYEVVDTTSGALKDLCYKAMIDRELESIYEAGQYFKEKADQTALTEEVIEADGYGPKSRTDIDQAVFLFKQGADRKHPDCMYQYGLYQAETRKDAQLKANGERLIALASEAGQPDAMVYIGNACLEGTNSFQKNLEYARLLFEKAGAKGHPAALGQLGAIYGLGIGCDVDFTASAKYTRLAAEAGFPQAQYNMHVIYRNGIGLNIDHSNAVGWLTKAADQEHPQAMYALAELIQAQEVPDRTYADALEYYTKCLVYDEYRAAAALGIAIITTRLEDHLKGWIKAACHLQECYEIIYSKGDSSKLQRQCIELSKQVVKKIREHISINNIDISLNGSDLMTCALFDTNGVPLIDRISRLKQMKKGLDALGSKKTLVDGETAAYVFAEAGIKLKDNLNSTNLEPKSIEQGTSKQRIGRNAPCHCGSGKKFKKCHGL